MLRTEYYMKKPSRASKVDPASPPKSESLISSFQSMVFTRILNHTLHANLVSRLCTAHLKVEQELQ